MIEKSNSIRWNYRVVGKTASDFRKTCDTKPTIALLEEVKTVFHDRKTQKRIEHYIERFNEIAKLRDDDYYEFEKKHNQLLNKVWDFFDSYGILIY